MNDSHTSLRKELSKVIFGQDDAIEFALAALFSCGHIILEGPPGVAKTLLVRTLAAALDLEYGRIQMTADLLPTDITGSSIYRDDTHTFEFRKGPIFANFVLADEINRASARTQSALLEAMQELHVTYDGVSYPLPEPFIVFATQNPIEQEGTYPLPLAQLDRFMFKVNVAYPAAADERRILREHHATGGLSSPEKMLVNKVLAPEAIIESRRRIRETHVRDEVIDYVQRLVQATRTSDSLLVGASPRSGLMLLMGAKSLARFAGRDFVTPDDVKTALQPALRHRVVLSPTAELEGTTTDSILAELMEIVEVPPVTVRPGVNLVRCAIAVAAAGAAAFVWPPVLALIGVAIAALAVAAAVERRRLKEALDKVTVSRTLPPVIGRGVPFERALIVQNAGPLPIRGEPRDEHPTVAKPQFFVHDVTIAAGARGRFSTMVQIPRRGRHAFGPVWLRVVGAWQLVEVHRAFDCRSTVSVLPETFASRDRLQKDLRAEMRLLDERQRSRQFGTGTEFESLYPFRFGDDPRRIDWRATARHQSLVVRRFQVERHRDVMIIIDSGRLMGADVGRGSKLDCAVDAALNLARVVLHGGDRCGVAAYDQRVRGFLPPIAGRSALQSLTECVFDLDTKWHESDFTPMLAELRARQAKRTFLIVISDLADAETSQRLCASLHQLKRQHLVLFAALKTPLLGRIVDETIHTPRDVARKAVVFRLLRDRRRAIHSLSRGGIHVLDVEPQQLTTPLINQFVDLRQRNLL